MKASVETTEALLPSAGYSYMRWTRHKYVRSEVITLPAVTPGFTLTGLGHMFRCQETGELRRWGFDGTSEADTN
jgi:hypothetical protein